MNNKSIAAAVVILLLVAGTTATWIAWSKEKKRSAAKELAFTETEAKLLHTRDSLERSLATLQAEKMLLKEENAMSRSGLDKATERNIVLEKSIAGTRQALNNSNKSLEESKAALEAEKDAALEREARITALEKDMARISDQLDKTNATLGVANNNLTAAEEKSRADSAAHAAKVEDLLSKIPVEGWFILPEITAGYGLGETSVPFSKYCLGVMAVGGYRFDERISAGIGLGLSVYDGGTLFPLYLDFRYNILPGKWSPVLIADGGMIFSSAGINDTRLFINPSLGVRRTVSEKMSLYGSIGCLTQTASTGGRSSFLNLKIGVMFNR